MNIISDFARRYSHSGIVFSLQSHQSNQLDVTTQHLSVIDDTLTTESIHNVMQELVSTVVDADAAEVVVICCPIKFRFA